MEQSKLTYGVRRLRHALETDQSIPPLAETVDS